MIASDESLCYSRPIQITLQTKMVIAGNDHVLPWGQTLWHWRRTLLALETNTFKLEMNIFNDCLSHSYLPMKQVHNVEEIQRYVDEQ